MQRSHTLNDIYQQHYCYCVAPLSPTVNMPLHFRLYVFCTDGRLHINYAISRYQSRIHRPCDIASSRDRMICTNSRLTRVLLAGPDQTHKQCWPAIIISGTVIKRPGYSDSTRLPTHQHMHCLVCSLYVAHQHPPCSSRQRWRVDNGSGEDRASWMASMQGYSHACGPRRVRSTDVCRSYLFIKCTTAFLNAMQWL